MQERGWKPDLLVYTHQTLSLCGRQYAAEAHSKTPHWQMPTAKGGLRYLRGVSRVMLNLHHEKDTELHAHVVAGWGN